MNKVGAEHPLPRGLCNLGVWLKAGDWFGFLSQASACPGGFPGLVRGQGGQGVTPCLPKTSAVIGHPLPFCTGLCCFLERVLRVRQLCAPSRSCPPSSQRRLSGGTLGTTADVGHCRVAWSLNRIPLPPVLAREEGFTNFSLFTPISSPKAEEDLLAASCPHAPQPFYGGLRKALAHWLQVACWAAHVSFCKKCLTCHVVPAPAGAVCQEQPRNWPRGSHM